MKRAPSALVAIGGFGVAVATLSVATTTAIVLLAPQPPAQRVSPASAIAALREDVPGFERSYDTAPPAGPRAMMIEQMVAAELRRPPSAVRILWQDGTIQRSVSIRSAQMKVALGHLTSKPKDSAFILMENKKGGFQMVEPAEIGGATRKAFLALPLPAFGLSVQQDDGRWLTVRAVRPFLGGWQVSILIALAVSLLLLAPIAWLFARRLTRPFRALAGALSNNADAVPAEGPRELRDAAAAIARMRTRLAAEAGERARMLTAIAHDLRTPLTSLRLRIESAPQPQRTRMVADVDRMQTMIGEVLDFARDLASPPEMVEVRPLLAGIVADMEAGEAVQLSPGDDAQVTVPPLAFRRAIENLVRNAIDYAGGGTIRLSRGGGEMVLSVADAGPGIPAVDRERILLPFERGEASRNRDTGGAGLGLSIVRDFAAQHRGSFSLLDAAGGGTVAELRLPLACI